MLRQQRIVSKVTAITQTEQQLRTLRQQMEDNRSKGHALYQASTTGAEECEIVIDETHATELKFAEQVRKHLYHVIVNAFELRYIALLGISIQTQIDTTTGIDVPGIHVRIA